MEGKNERVKYSPRKTRHVRFGAYGKLRLYLNMFLCVLRDLSVFLSIFLRDPSAILCTCLFKEDLPVCVPEGPVTYLQDKRTSDLDPLPIKVWFLLLLQSGLWVHILKTETKCLQVNWFQVNWFAETSSQVSPRPDTQTLRTHLVAI
ncbi:hypothetical protein Bbelb_126590 [Branchiostoma belcheri]|nr:hypothetical protein Bbelb_126590 [Branchiostoma belcheri]